MDRTSYVVPYLFAFPFPADNVDVSDWEVSPETTIQ